MLVTKDNQMYLVISAISCLGSMVHLILIPVFLWLNILPLAIYNVGSVIVWVISWQANQQGKAPIAISLMSIEVSLHTILTVALIGWEPGFQYYLMAGIPFTLFNTRFKHRDLILISAIFCIIFCTLYGITKTIDYHNIPASIITIFHYINSIISFVAIGLSSFYFRVASLASEKYMEQLASTDPLTGLYNRRKIRELLDRQHALALRDFLTFSLVLVDIDHFKQINDLHGHDCGDAVLCAVAQLMSQRLRKSDAVARWGGEEFLLLLPGTHLTGAYTIAEELRCAIARHPFEHNGQILFLTITCGVVQHKAKDSIDDSIKRADSLLYQGKETGRNQVAF